MDTQLELCAWVKRLADNWRGRRDSLTGDSVRDSCADELEKVAASHATPQPAAGWNEAIKAAIDIVKPWPGAEGFAESEADKAVERVRREFVAALESLRREAPAPAEGVLTLGPENEAFHRALKQYPEGFAALHFFWNEVFAGQPQSRPKESEGGTFQSRVQPWMMACFGPEISADRTERNHRFLEEALELVQSNGCTPDEAHQLVDYVYGRPQGEINQEVGGVMVTLAALCLANGIDMHKGGETELARVWTKVEQIRAKQAAKPKHSPLPGPSEPLVGRREEQLRIQALGAAISRRDWHAAERAYEIIRDRFDRPSEPPPPADRREIVAWFKDRIDKYETQLNATGQADVAHLLRRDTQIILAALAQSDDASRKRNANG